MNSPKLDTIRKISRSGKNFLHASSQGIREWLNKEFEQARFHSIRTGAEKGNALAEYGLGSFYENGQHGLRSDYEAYKWFLRAAFQGIADAQAKVSEFNQHGRGVQKNLDEAFNWCRKAAEQGHLSSQIRLAQMYCDAIGTPRNPVEARKWCDKAISRIKANRASIAQQDELENLALALKAATTISAQAA
jgi:TPR repeat protein